MRAQASPDRGMSVPHRSPPSTHHLTPAGEPTSPLLRLKKRRALHQAISNRGFLLRIFAEIENLDGRLSNIGQVVRYSGELGSPQESR